MREFGDLTVGVGGQVGRPAHNIEPPINAIAPEVPLKKPRPNHQKTLEVLRGMTPEQKLQQVFKLNERTLELMRIGIRERYPNLTDEQRHEIFLKMRLRCHNRNY